MMTRRGVGGAASAATFGRSLPAEASRLVLPGAEGRLTYRADAG
jgi:hypothetical protein